MIFAPLLILSLYLSILIKPLSCLMVLLIRRPQPYLVRTTALHTRRQRLRYVTVGKLQPTQFFVYIGRIKIRMIWTGKDEGSSSIYVKLFLKRALQLSNWATSLTFSLSRVFSLFSFMGLGELSEAGLSFFCLLM